MIKEKEIVDFVRLALSGNNSSDIVLLAQRIARKHNDEFPTLSKHLKKLCREAKIAKQSSFRDSPHKVIPVDQDTRLDLIRKEHPVSLDFRPSWNDKVSSELDLFLTERQKQSRLIEAGLKPSRSLLFHGLPGTGKTLAARMIANKLNLPLLTLDLSSVMSSFLGRTGVNIRRVLEYAKEVECVLLLDELDAIAKRRDDTTEIGELKRLVTVLLQEIDLWPDTGILIAATNHSELLDPAVWRRFDRAVEFPLPDEKDIVRLLIHDIGDEIQDETILLFSPLLEQQSYSDIVRLLSQAKRQSVLQGISLQETLWLHVKVYVKTLSRSSKKKIALHLVKKGYNDTQISKRLSMSRDTVRLIRKEHNS